MQTDRSDIYKIDLNPADWNDVRIIAAEFIEPGSIVMDVGSACGDFGVLLGAQKGCRVHGLDSNQQSNSVAMESNAYEQIHQVDLNAFDKAGFPGYSGYFDVIVLLDVLEHLLQPEDVLRAVVDFLKPGAALIISLPNISFGGIKIDLLQNRFDYTDTGILDRTHLRFFTHRSIAQLLTGVGLEIAKCRCKVRLLTEATTGVPRSIIRHVEEDPHSFVYQYVVKVVVSSKKGSDLQASNLEKMNIGWGLINRDLRRLKNLRLVGKVFPKQSLRRRLAKNVQNMFKRFH